ncbi:MAG: hypothetical protein NTU44_13975 [Bacteroidetes bacterium]|nr:hypothetical protein [Bacteroidota bacterium]
MLIFRRLGFSLFALLLMFVKQLSAQPVSDSAKNASKVKTGWNVGFLPIVAFNSDLGLQYGGLVNLFNYGDGSRYPMYDHQFYGEISRTTKGGGINQFFYDSDKLIRKTRFTLEFTYLTEKALDFYGFNGYQAVYNQQWEDDSRDSLTYKSRLFYRHERKLFRTSVDFTGKLTGRKLKWQAGFTYLDTKVGPVDLNKLNKGLSKDSKLPDIPGLYDEYVSWGVIKPTDARGGRNALLRLGIIFDTRDNEANPMKGTWSEAIIAVTPAPLSSHQRGFARFALIHRQYFTLIKEDLSFAYRIGLQGVITGETPFYLLPYMIMSYSRTTTIDGLGGSSTLRGILRNRDVGQGMAYSNAEFRWKFLHFRLARQFFYLALNGFGDVGLVIQKVKVDRSAIPSTVDQSEYFRSTAESPHLSLGAGFRIAMNQNFIICCDYGHVADKRDGKSGVYIGLGYLF